MAQSKPPREERADERNYVRYFLIDTILESMRIKIDAIIDGDAIGTPPLLLEPRS
jgi:hypothetical protein